VPSSPQRRKAGSPAEKPDIQLIVALIGASGVVIAAFLGAAGMVLVAFITLGAAAHTGSAGPGNSASTPVSAPAPVPSIVPQRLPLGTPSSTDPRPQPTESEEPVPFPAALNPPGIVFGISIVSAPDMPDAYIAPLSLLWKSSLLIGDRIIDAGCQITWDLYRRATSIYAAKSGCNGTYKLPFQLEVGKYTLIGQATLGSQDIAREMIMLQVV